MVKMLIVCVGSIWFGDIGIFRDRKLYMKTWYSYKIIMSFFDFSCDFFGPKCPDTPKFYTT